MILRQFWGVISILCIITLEVLIDYANMHLGYSFELTCFNCISILFYAIMGIFILSVAFNWKYIHFSAKKTHFKDRILLLVANSCSGSVLDILFVLVFIFNLAWIPDSIFDIAKEGGYFYRPFMYIIGLFLMIYIKPINEKNREKISEANRKVLITGLSEIKYNGTKGNIFINIEPVITPFSQYPKIKVLLILLSTGVLNGVESICEKVPKDHRLYKDFEIYKKKTQEFLSKKKGGVTIGLTDKDEIATILTPLLKACIRSCYSHVDTENLVILYTSPVDYNVFEECNEKLYAEITALLNERHHCKQVYSDADLLVNITAGTSAVSGVMTLNAIKGDRGLIYTEQYLPYKLQEFNPNVIVLEQFRGLTQEFQERNE